MQPLRTLLPTLLATLILSAIPPGDKKFIDTANMDLTVRPGDDFYAYANGNWIRQNPVPPSQTRWGAFNILREQSAARLRDLLEAAASAPTDSLSRKVGDFYASGMDSLTLEKLGAEPIRADLDRIAAIRTRQDLFTEIAYERNHGIATSLMGFTVVRDRKNVSSYIPELGQGGITLPDRDYYLKHDARSTAIRAAYQTHLRKMFGMLGMTGVESDKAAQAVFHIETALAGAELSRTDLRDPYKTYNKYAWRDLSSLTPDIDWKTLADMMQIKNADSLVVIYPTFLQAVDTLLGAATIDEWKDYLGWHVIHTAAPWLNSAFVGEAFSFDQVLSGQKEQNPRWQRVSLLIDRQLGEMLGQLYVARYFSPAAKQRMLELVDNLQATFADRIKRLDWMSPETKERALEKLKAITKKIGYPDKWKDYKGVVISRDNLLGNIRSCVQWDYQDNIDHLGKPVDKTIWTMTPPTINAYYNPTGNEIVFPAGILQFPFFDFDADDALNYGGIGAVIGHEMTHGFDDEGRKYAADGNLKDWWTPADAKQFKERADEVVAQYDAYTVLDTLHVNGKLTLGENLADLGGLSIAYEAFTHTQQFKEGKKIDGFTPAQRFFLNWEQVWRGDIRPQTAAQLLLTDPHSPANYRGNGPITNIDAWYEAFSIKKGAQMYKPAAQRIRIW